MLPYFSPITEAIDYDGGNRQTILRGSPAQNLYSASVFQSNLYLTSWRNNSILRVNKFHPETDHATVLDGLERPFAIQVFHRQRQPILNGLQDGLGLHPCSTSPCDHVRTFFFFTFRKNTVEFSYSTKICPLQNSDQQKSAALWDQWKKFRIRRSKKN